MINLYTIMIVEDDITTRLELTILFQNSGYNVKSVEDFSNVAEQIRQTEPHLVLMDMNLPDCTGLEICMKVRTFSEVPIIFVTSCNTTADELRCITMGGDDFVAKPYNIAILLGRVTNILRRTYGGAEKSAIFSHNGVEFDSENGKLSYNGNTIELTWSEVKILTCLFRNKGKYVSRISLIEYLWENKLYIDDNTLSVNVTRIRKKLSDCGLDNFIETKRGMGYKI